MNTNPESKKGSQEGSQDKPIEFKERKSKGLGDIDVKLPIRVRF